MCCRCSRRSERCVSTIKILYIRTLLGIDFHRLSWVWCWNLSPFCLKKAWICLSLQINTEILFLGWDSYFGRSLYSSYYSKIEKKSRSGSKAFSSTGRSVWHMEYKDWWLDLNRWQMTDYWKIWKWKRRELQNIIQRCFGRFFF